MNIMLTGMKGQANSSSLGDYDDCGIHQPLGRFAVRPMQLSSLALRVVLFGLLVATAASKVHLARTYPPDMRAAVVSLAEDNGLLVSKAPDWQTGAQDDPITFRAPECEGAGRIFVVELGLQSLPMLNQIVDQGYSRRFVYLGRTWPTHDRMGMRLEWLKRKPLSLFGLGEYDVNETALLITEPPDCSRADRIDWGILWAHTT
jgi:hypothetical protein